MNATEMIEVASEAPPTIELKKLSERHKTAASLLAQGVQRQTIAAAVDYTPEYITWLQRQPLFIEYVREMTAAASIRLEALFDKSVDTIAETMVHGSDEDKLKAAKLQLEATGRVGRNAEQARPETGDRLDLLAERLVGLLHRERKRVIDVQDVEIISQR